MNRALIATLFILLFAASCRKADAGPAGQNGTNGTNGNANVHGTILTATGTSWQWDPVNDREFCVLTDSTIDNGIYDSGTVEVFQQTGNASWIALPYSFAPQGAPYTLAWYYMYSVGSLSVYAQASNQTQVNLTGIDQYFKVVSISAGVRRANPHTNWRDYEAVMKVVDNAPAAGR